MNLYLMSEVIESYEDKMKPDKSKMFRSWQERVRVLHKAAMGLRTEMETKAKDFADTYASKVAREKIDELEKEFNGAVGARADMFREELDEIVKAKKEQLRKVALSAPDEETVRLLQTLALRDDLTETEVFRLAQGMAGNFQAVHALKSLAKKSNVSLPAPTSVEVVEQRIDDAAKFALEMLERVTKPDKE